MLTDKQARCEDLVKAKEALDKFVEFNLAVASQTVYASLHKYFEPRKKASRHDPRFCIKLLKKKSSSDFVYTFTRDEGSKSKLEVNFETACEKNTGFYYVSQSGKPFFCNDLTKEKTYKNPRLNADRVAGYSSSIMFSIRRFFASNPLTDEDWVNCWSEEGSNIRPPASSCYKSTLIVPMTLLAKQVTPEFSSAYNSRWPPDQDKYNFGYLCIDCHEVDFFEDYDRVALFSHADMFSLFLIEAHSFTVHSFTYAEVEKSLSSQKPRAKKK